MFYLLTSPVLSLTSVVLNTLTTDLDISDTVLYYLRAHWELHRLRLNQARDIMLCH